jgi:hypothetical protein
VFCLSFRQTAIGGRGVRTWAKVLLIRALLRVVVLRAAWRQVGRVMAALVIGSSGSEQRLSKPLMRL